MAGLAMSHLFIDLVGEEVLDVDVAHLEEVLHAVVAHGAPGEEELGDGEVSDPQLAVHLRQPHVRFAEADFVAPPQPRHL